MSSSALGGFKALNVIQGTFTLIAILVYCCTRAHVIDEIPGQKRAIAALMESPHRHILRLPET